LEDADYFDFSYFQFEPAQKGRYYVGVYGLEQAGYNLQVLPFSPLPTYPTAASSHSTSSQSVINNEPASYSVLGLALGLTFGILFLAAVIGALALGWRVLNSKRNFKQMMDEREMTPR